MKRCFVIVALAMCLVLVGVIAQLANAQHTPPHPPIPRPEKPQITSFEQRDLLPFTRVELTGLCNLNIVLGDTHGVRVSGAARDLNALTVQVVDGTLVIKEKPHNWTFRGRPTAIITARQINAVTVNGSGNVEFTDKRTGPLTVAVNGSGDMTLGGRSDSLTINIAGSGDIDAEQLTAGNTKVSILGSGDVELGEIIGALTIDLKGSGDVQVKRLKATAVVIELAASGGVELAGSAEQATINIAASGKVRARKLITGKATISITGSGSVELGVTESLTASIFGSGNVVYYGSPQHVRSQIRGSGQVSRGGER